MLIFFFGKAYVTLLSTTGYKVLKYSSRIHSYGLPGRTTTEQIIQFPVCANVGVLFTLDILSQACEKHIQTPCSLEQFRFWSITQPIMLCYVSVHSRAFCLRHRARDAISVAVFDRVALFSDFNHLPVFELLDQVLLPIAVVPFLVRGLPLAHHLNRSNLHLNSSGSKVLGSNLCRYLRRANLPPSGQELTTKLATGFRQDHFRVRKPLNHTTMWTNYLSQVREMTNH